MLIVRHGDRDCYLLRVRTDFYVDHYHYPLHRSAVFAIPVDKAERVSALQRILACFPARRDERAGYFLRRLHDLTSVRENVTRDRRWTDPVVAGTVYGRDPHFTAALADLVYL